MLRHLLVARVALSPGLPPLHPEPVALPVAPMTFDTSAAALAWFEAERANLVATTRLAQAYGLHALGWQLPTAMYGFFDLRKHYADWLATHEIAPECAREVGDREAQGRILCNIGNAYRPLRRDAEALGYYLRALDLFRAVGYRQGQAKVWGNLGSCYEVVGRLEEAADAHERSLEIFREIGDRYGEALTLTNFGELHLRAGRYPEALQHHRMALATFTDIDDGQGISGATSNLGVVLSAQGDHRAALDLQQRALAGYRGVGDRYEEANTLVHLGDVRHALGRHGEAASCWRVRAGRDRRIASSHRAGRTRSGPAVAE